MINSFKVIYDNCTCDYDRNVILGSGTDSCPMPYADDYSSVMRIIASGLDESMSSGDTAYGYAASSAMLTMSHWIM